MREFFKPWRRKLGVVTLVMACLLMAGWVRSVRKLDHCSFHVSEYSFHTFSSCNGRVAWQRIEPADRTQWEWNAPWVGPKLFREIAGGSAEDFAKRKLAGIPTEDEQIEWRWRWIWEAEENLDKLLMTDVFGKALEDTIEKEVEKRIAIRKDKADAR